MAEAAVLQNEGFSVREAAQAVNYHTKEAMLDYLGFMRDQLLDSSMAASAEERAHSLKFGLVMSHFIEKLKDKVYTKENVQYVYGQIRKNERFRMRRLEERCLEPWQERWRELSYRSKEWEKSGMDEVRQKFGVDPDMEIYRDFKGRDLSRDPAARAVFEEFLVSGDLPGEKKKDRGLSVEVSHTDVREQGSRRGMEL